MSLNITLKLSSSVDKNTLKFYHHQLIRFNLHPGIIKTVVTLRVAPLCTEHSLQYFDNCTLVVPPCYIEVRLQYFDNCTLMLPPWNIEVRLQYFDTCSKHQLAIPFQSVVVLRELVHLWWFYYFENCPPGAPHHASWCITPHTLVH